MSETHKEHPSPTKYVQIAIVLAILTAIEVALYYTEDIVGALAAPLLIVLAVGKFVIVVGWFMHLRYENSLINKFFCRRYDSCTYFVCNSNDRKGCR